MTPEEQEQLFKPFNRSLIFKSDLLNLFEDTFQAEELKGKSFQVVDHPGAAVMIPIDENGKIILIKQYRHPIQKVIYEFPAGKIDNNEPFEECAIRELREEINMRPNHIKEILTSYPAPGYSNEMLKFFIASDLVEDSLEGDADEALEIVRMKPDEIHKLIMNGDITDGKTITGIYIYEQYRKLNA